MTDQAFPGHYLRQRREEYNLTADDVYRHIRIPSEYLEALERGEIDTLPNSCYTLGFIKTYCEFLGLMPEPFVESARNRQRTPNRFFSLKRRTTATAKGPLFPWAADVVAWAAICAFIGFAWCAYVFVVRPQDDITDHQVQAGTIEMVVPPAPGDLDF